MTVYPVQQGEDFKAKYKLCSGTRLFLPQLLPDLDQILYVDRDVVIMDDLRPLWALRGCFGIHQMVALSIETDDPGLSFYRSAHAAINPWGLAGLNSGVILFHLANMRAANTNETFVKLNAERASLCTGRYGHCLGDQDVLNVWLHDDPSLVVPLGCRWNFRDDCRAAERASILHFNRQARYATPNSLPRSLYETVLRWPLLRLNPPLISDSLQRANAANFTRRIWRD